MTHPIIPSRHPADGGVGVRVPSAIRLPVNEHHDLPAPPALAARRRRVRFDPRQVGWRIGTAHEPRGGELWCPWDRTAGVIGPQGSGKTLDLLTPALLGAPGAALVTLTKLDDLLLTLQERQRDGRPCVVLDPFGLAPGVTDLTWDPIEGCVDPHVAERRAKAFTAGTVKASAQSGSGDAAARFYAAEAAKVLQCYFHAAALVGDTLDAVLHWVAKPLSSPRPAEILTEHPHAAPFWAGLLQGALHGDDRTAGNTITTVQQALALFFQPDIRRRCVPGPGRPAVDVAAIIRRNGTFYLLGREDPYASASPLMTAVAEHILDTALQLASASPYGRLCPPMLSCLDEMPSTAPLPTLITRMANERALGLSFIWAAQTRRQLDTIFGEQQARALFGLTNVLILFGGSKDVAFNKEVSDLAGPVRVARTSWNLGQHGGRTASGEDIPIITADEVRQIPARQALVVAENAKPLIARLTRSIDGKPGRALLAQQRAARDAISVNRATQSDAQSRTAEAHAEARRRNLNQPRSTP
nr:type IV secretory system conjugative DNA transfer family protein [Propionibacterium sp.]